MTTRPKITTPAGYLASLPPERRKVIAAVRAVIRKKLPKGYVEAFKWGMLAYQVPLSRYPDTYNKQPLMYLALAAQKNHYAFYTTNVRHDTALLTRVQAAFTAAGKRLDMGGGCIRFTSLADLPLKVVGDITATTSVAAKIKAAEAARKT